MSPCPSRLASTSRYSSDTSCVPHSIASRHTAMASSGRPESLRTSCRMTVLTRSPASFARRSAGSASSSSPSRASCQPTCVHAPSTPTSRRFGRAGAPSPLQDSHEQPTFSCPCPGRFRRHGPRRETDGGAVPSHPVPAGAVLGGIPRPEPSPHSPISLQWWRRPLSMPGTVVERWSRRSRTSRRTHWTSTSTRLSASSYGQRQFDQPPARVPLLHGEQGVETSAFAGSGSGPALDSVSENGNFPGRRPSRSGYTQPSRYILAGWANIS